VCSSDLIARFPEGQKEERMAGAKLRARFFEEFSPRVTKRMTRTRKNVSAVSSRKTAPQPNPEPATLPAL
jgi:hypothetical protein